MTCTICGWQRATRKGRCEGCRKFLKRHGRDKTPAEIAASYNRQLDRIGRLLEVVRPKPVEVVAPVLVRKLEPAAMSEAIDRLRKGA